MSKAVGKITFNAEDVLEAGFFSRLLFGCPVQQGAVVGGTKGSHAALNGQVNVILIFGAGIKNRAFVIVKVIAEVIWTGNFYSPPVIYFKSPAGAGNEWSWAAPWLEQISFGFGRVCNEGLGVIIPDGGADFAVIAKVITEESTFLIDLAGRPGSGFILGQRLIDIGNLIDISKSFLLEFRGIGVRLYKRFDDELLGDRHGKLGAEKIRFFEIQHGKFNLGFIHTGIAAGGFDRGGDGIVNFGAVDDADTLGFIARTGCGVPGVTDLDILEHDPGEIFDCITGLFQCHSVDYELAAMLQ